MAQHLTIQWKNVFLSCQTNTQTKIILKDLNGKVCSGESLSIMGPSGSGKSSLLSILAARIRMTNSAYKMDGNVLMNGSKYSLEEFSQKAAYVQQDDMLFGTLTVKQTFEFQALLKLHHKTQEEQSFKVEHLLKKLNLYDCKDVLIGNSQFRKCISGGQKKRVAIGVELIQNPDILIFDEPTSGLDSHNAYKIMKLLGSLAKQENKIIITTIHQPSTMIFNLMDQLYLIKNGQNLYHGKASNIVKYMQQIYVQIDFRMNPADFMMLEISQIKENQRGTQSLLNAKNFKKFQGFEVHQEKQQRHQITQQQRRQQRHQISQQQRHQISQQQRHQIIMNDDKKNQNLQNNTSTPFLRQFRPLFMRSFKNFYRTPSNQLNKLVTSILIPVLLGTMYYGIGNDAPDLSGQFDPEELRKFLQDFCSFIFMSQYFIFAMNTYDTTLIFPNEKDIVLKEVSSNLYSILSYYITRLLTEILGCIIPAVICAFALYYMADLDSSFHHVFIFVAIFVLLALDGYLFGLFFGVLCKDSNAGINLLPIALIPFLVFGGLVVNLETVGDYISWAQYTSPLRHGYFMLLIDQFQSEKLHHYFDNPFIMERVGVNGDFFIALYYTIGMTVFFLLASIALLYLFKKSF